MSTILNTQEETSQQAVHQTIQKALRRIDIEPATGGFTRTAPLWDILAKSMSRYRVDRRTDDTPVIDRLRERLFLSWVSDTPLSLQDLRALSQSPETHSAVFLRPVPITPSTYAAIHRRLTLALPEIYRPLLPPAPITKNVEETGTDLKAWPPLIHTTRASYPEKLAEMEQTHHKYLTRHGIQLHAISATASGTTPTLHLTSPLTGLVCTFDLKPRHAHILNLWVDQSRAPEALRLLGYDAAKDPKTTHFNTGGRVDELAPPPPKDWYDEFESIFDVPQWVAIRQKAILRITDYGPSLIAPACRLLTGKSAQHFPMKPRTLTPEHHLTTPMNDSEREQFNLAHKDHKAHQTQNITPIFAGLPFDIDPANPDFRPGEHEWRMTVPLHPRVRIELENFMAAIETKIPYADMESAIRRAAVPLLDKLDRQITETRKQLFLEGE